jgi:hypothetical protein
MDPLSIAAGAVGLATASSKIVTTLYTWIDDTVDVDDTVRGLCDETAALSRVLDTLADAVSRTPRLIIADLDADGSLFERVRATMDDIKVLLDKLSAALVVVDKLPRFAVGILRRPAKQVKFSLKSRDIAAYKDRIKTYNAAMTSTLQMINVYDGSLCISC